MQERTISVTHSMACLAFIGGELFVYNTFEPVLSNSSKVQTLGCRSSGLYLRTGSGWQAIRSGGLP